MPGVAARNASADAFGRQPIVIGSETLIADLSGALYWPARQILIVADLHFEKGSSYARHGQFLPPYDTRDTLQRLAALLKRYNDARTLIALGDSLHDRSAHQRLAPDDLAMLRELQAVCDWIWVCGNHDPVVDISLGGRVTDVVEIGGLVLRHEPSPARDFYEIAGHLHPAARIVQHGCSIRRPCFVGDRSRLVLPAFGAYTGGLNVLDPAFLPLWTEEAGFSVWMLGQDGVYPVPVAMLRED
ncbi:ligase-associated DNA damage response endonuclease PdeM [Filomicrobium sp.]|uniref:ligase-associated DNA damage response endonuclease PdeM n=1 Tax=Filomicrobium sp. TaxID=2024831 RepID=UPI002590332D|nr:ligase-associated DNA damage response endonuclease PdeM [Filomicrobium sp.]MCV0367820.1 ligase-associated DNA damage response endonuclease PdeM [Filomicrobium sp.]